MREEWNSELDEEETNPSKKLEGEGLEESDLEEGDEDDVLESSGDGFPEEY